MEPVLLLPKNECSHSKLVVFDEIFNGLLTNEFFVPVFTGSVNGFTIIPISFLIDNYKWPKKDDRVLARISYFITGHNKKLLTNIEFYIDETIEV